MAINGLGFPFVIDTTVDLKARELEAETAEFCKESMRAAEFCLANGREIDKDVLIIHQETGVPIYEIEQRYNKTWGFPCEWKKTLPESRPLSSWGGCSFDYSQSVSLEENNDYAKDVSAASAEGALTCYSESPIFRNLLKPLQITLPSLDAPRSFDTPGGEKLHHKP